MALTNVASARNMPHAPGMDLHVALMVPPDGTTSV
jgi:hypothetical protein